MPDNLLLSLKPGYLRLGNILLAAEIQHFLSFFETADEGAAEIASTKDEAAGMNPPKSLGVGHHNAGSEHCWHEQ
ncbi:MAG: hypothetical protein LUQ52_09380 [Methylococcaceae bacterium]|nr:hypothetical protein [Methylococcaceae bacterium]